MGKVRMWEGMAHAGKGEQVTEVVRGNQVGNTAFY